MAIELSDTTSNVLPRQFKNITEIAIIPMTGSAAGIRMRETCSQTSSQAVAFIRHPHQDARAAP